MRVSPKQQEALTKLRDKDGSAYSMKVRINTLEALSRIGLVRPVGSGHMLAPASAQWRITDAGKAASFKMTHPNSATH